SVCKKSRHTCSRQTSSRRVFRAIVSIKIFRIAVYRLSLSLTPAYTPCRMSSRCRNRNYIANIIRTKESPFENLHAAHRSTETDCNLFYSQHIENFFVESSKSKCGINE